MPHLAKLANLRHLAIKAAWRATDCEQRPRWNHEWYPLGRGRHSHPSELISGAASPQEQLAAADVTRIVKKVQNSSSDPATARINILDRFGNNIDLIEWAHPNSCNERSAAKLCRGPGERLFHEVYISDADDLVDKIGRRSNAMGRNRHAMDDYNTHLG